MAERYSFFNDVNGDRVYQASDFVEYFKQFNSNGVFKNPSNNLQVSASSGMSVTVSAGAGYINGYLYILDQAKTLTLLASDPNLNRKDIIVLNLDFINRNMSILVKRGTAASTAIAPTPANSASMIEIVLAEISIPKGLTSITSSNITDTRGDSSRCGFVKSNLSVDSVTDGRISTLESDNTSNKTRINSLESSRTTDETNITNLTNNKRDKTDKTFNDGISMGPNLFLGTGTEMFLNNSDISGVNGLFLADSVSTTGEGIFFPKTGTASFSTSYSSYDRLYVLDGILYANEPFQAGNTSITPVANTTTSKTITFKIPYTTAPIVTATAITGGPGSNVQEVSVNNVTTTGFDIVIYRTNTIDTWVNWTAMPKTQ